jgi:hypothetical protein
LRLRLDNIKSIRDPNLPVIEKAPNLINMAIILHPIAQFTAEVLAARASAALLGGAGNAILTLPFLCFDSVMWYINEMSNIYDIGGIDGKIECVTFVWIERF